MACSSSTSPPSISELTAAFKSAITLLESAESFDHIISHERAAVEFTSQLRSVTYKIEKALAKVPSNCFEISEIPLKDSDSIEEKKMHDSLVIPDDFLCPITRELFMDPVFVSTGQTYERSSIQSWINGGKRTCPKTRQILKNLDLTPNYVLRSLIADWCTDQKQGLIAESEWCTDDINDEQPTSPTNTTPRNTDLRNQRIEQYSWLNCSFYGLFWSTLLIEILSL